MTTGTRVRLLGDLTVLGGGYRGKKGVVIEVRNMYGGESFVVVRLDDGEVVADHASKIRVL